MIRVLRKTAGRTRRFLVDALTWRPPERQHAIVAWCLIAGATLLVASLACDPDWPARIVAGIYLMTVLAAVCAIDARFGIIPDSLVLALAAGGLLQSFLADQGEILWRIMEAAVFLAAGCLLRLVYRMVRGHDGLGLGDIKFATAGVLWIGIEGVPELLLVAVLSAIVSLVILKAEGHDLDGKQAIPFGPHLAVGLWLTWNVGHLQFGI
jgi:leader peptidase (prepilin peptidase) / N-methyltransferase